MKLLPVVRAICFLATTLLVSSCATPYSREDLAKMSPPGAEEYSRLGQQMRRGFPAYPKRMNAALRLGLSDDPQAMRILAKYLVDERDPVIVFKVRQILDRRRCPDVVPVLIRALKNKDWIVVQNACWLLGRYRNERAVGPLIHLLQSRNTGKRAGAAWALGKIGDRRASEPLIDRMQNDSHVAVQIIAARSLGEIGSSSSIEPLFDKLAHTWPRDCDDWNPLFVTGGSLTPRFMRSGAPSRSICTAIVGALGGCVAKGLSRNNDAVDLFLQQVQKHPSTISAVYEIVVLIGSPDTKDLLVNSLNTSGNEVMAVDFINSGNARLKQSAEAWLKRTRIQRGAKKTVGFLLKAFASGIQMTADKYSYKAAWGGYPHYTEYEADQYARQQQRRRETEAARSKDYQRPSGLPVGPQWGEIHRWMRKENGG